MQLDGITADNFEAAKAGIIDVIKQHFFSAHGVWLNDKDIQLSGSNRRRLSSTGFTLTFTVIMSAEAEPLQSTNSSNATDNASNPSTFAYAPVVALDAAEVGRLVVEAVESDAVAAALNVSPGTVSMTSFSDPTQDVTVLGECDAGKYAASGMSECTACAPGRASEKGSSGCSDCTPGSVAAVPGSAICAECPMGLYQHVAESTVCLRCRANALTANTGASSVQQCVCQKGHYDCTSGDPSVCKAEECNECPLDAKCDQAETLSSLQTNKGFWRAINDTTIFHQCPVEAACNGGSIIEGRDSQCAAGYVGVRCEACDYENGFALHHPGRKCAKCGETEGQNTVFLATGGFAGLLALFVVTQLRLWPAWLYRIVRVKVCSGQHEGRVGVLTGKRKSNTLQEETHTNVIDELASAMRTAKVMMRPPEPPSAFVLFMRAQEREESGSDDAEGLRKGYLMFQNLLPEDKNEYVRAACHLKATSDKQFALFISAQNIMGSEYEVKLGAGGDEDASTLFLLGSDLRLLPMMNAREAYEARVTKIKLTVQFLQICLRISVTYRLPLPPLTVDFLDGLAFLEVFDIVQIPMNLDCWRHFDFINKVRMHTAACFLIIFLLKVDPVKRIRVLCHCFVAMAERITCRMKIKAARQIEPLEALLVRGAKDTINQVRRFAPTLAGHLEHLSPAEQVDRKAEAVVKIQRLYRGNNNNNFWRRVACYNIAVLRMNLLQNVEDAKSLGREDFLLLFSFSVYSSLCDACFMYFDCSMYEDGNVYLAADVSIKCDGLEAGPYQESFYYVLFMSVIFPLGIPLYYLLSLNSMRNIINPPLPNVLKDQNYVGAFALGSLRTHLTYTDKDTGTVWTKRRKKMRTSRRKSSINSRKFSLLNRKSSLLNRRNSEILQNTHDWVWRWQDEKNIQMTPQQFKHMQEVLTAQWVQANPELAKSLQSMDYKSKFEQKRKQIGYRKAKDFIKRKSRAASVPARRFKFLWEPYRTGAWYFEAVDMFRRFLILGLPKVLRAIAPRIGIQKYIGLLVLSVAPVVYKHINAYQDHQDMSIMTLTQLAQIIVVLCGMVKQNVKGDGANYIITAIIMLTLLPMLVMLLAFVYDPSGKFLKRMLTSQKTHRIQTRSVAILEVLVSGHSNSDSEQVTHAKEEVVKAIKSKNEHFNQFEPADIKEIKLLYTKLGEIIEILGTGEEQIVLEDRVTEEALHDSIRELLLALGVGVFDSDVLLESESVKLRLMLWCLCPRFTPCVKWPDVATELEVLDGNQKLKEVALGPGKFLAGMAEKGRQVAELAATRTPNSDNSGSELASVEGVCRPSLLQASGVEQGGAGSSAVGPKFTNPTNTRSRTAAVHPFSEETDSESDDSDSDPPSNTGGSLAGVTLSSNDAVESFQNTGAGSSGATSTGAPVGPSHTPIRYIGTKEEDDAAL
jgi:hypothetical protein